MLAAAVNTDVLDIEALDRVAGGRAVAIWNVFYPWIHWRRLDLQVPTLYVELEQLAGSVAARRSLPFTTEPPFDADT